MSGTKHVLVIEDDITYGEMLQDALQQFGYDVSLAYSATGGLDYLRQNQVDVLLSDIDLPATTGIELAEKLVVECPHLPIILISSFNDIKLVRKALSFGVCDYLVKPVPLTDLPVVIEKGIERKRLEVQRHYCSQHDQSQETINMLMQAIDAKSVEMGSHIRAVVSLAMKFAIWVKLSPEETAHLKLASYLYDFGKLGMPDDIVQLAESMTASNYNIEYDYTLIGSNIIGEMDGMENVVETVRHQNEHVDGSGYPAGLKSEKIPLHSRILAILKQFQLAVQKNPMEPLTALADLRPDAGKRFDRMLFQQFEAMLIFNLGTTSDEDSQLAKLPVKGSSRK
ncbi:MAG: HD domain-containing phosphohydrolase [Calditrichia bacterium]